MVATSGVGLDQLANVPLFSACSKRELRLILDRGERVEVAAGRRLIREGDIGWMFFVVLSGAVEVKKRSRVLASLEEGDHFGELALLGRAQRSATVVAIEPTEVFCLVARAFDQLLDEVPALAKSLLTGLARRVVELEDELLSLSQRRART
jgi:CRP-like cAMP-binding protein